MSERKPDKFDRMAPKIRKKARVPIAGEGVGLSAIMLDHYIADALRRVDKAARKSMIRKYEIHPGLER